MISRGYIAAAVRRAGVRPMWQEDAVQDCMIAMWRRGLDRRAVWSLAIDAARKYGYHWRGSYRPVLLPLSIDLPYTHDVDARLDVERALMGMTPMRRRAFRRWWWDKPLSVNERALANKVKRQLRREAA